MQARSVLASLWVLAGGCGDGSPGLADGTGTGGPTDTDTETDTEAPPSSTAPPPECFGEGAMDPFGTSGHPDSGDQECGEHELCVIDQCVPIPYAPVEACAPAVSPDAETVPLPVALGGIAAADLDDDGMDEIWGFDFEGGSIRGFDLDANELGAIETELALSRGVAARWEGAPDSLLFAASATVGDGVEWSLVHAWPGEAGLELAEPQPLADRVDQLIAEDFDGDGSIEVVVDYGHERLELWSVASESAPAMVESRAGSYDTLVLPLPDGGGRGLAMRGVDTEYEDLYYYAVTSAGLEHVATRSVVQGMPAAFGAFRNASTVELLVEGAEAFSEFDHAYGYGLGTVDASAVQVPSLHLFSLLNGMGDVLVADLDARPVVTVATREGGLFIRFDPDGTPCTTSAGADLRYGQVVGDFDGDGNRDLLVAAEDSVTIFSAP